MTVFGIAVRFVGYTTSPDGVLIPTVSGPNFRAVRRACRKLGGTVSIKADIRDLVGKSKIYPGNSGCYLPMILEYKVGGKWRQIIPQSSSSQTKYNIEGRKL